MSGCPDHSSVSWASLGAGEASWPQEASGLPDRVARPTPALGSCKLSWPLRVRRKRGGVAATALLHSRDADFLQVALSEGQEDAEVHVLLLEHLQVLQTPNLLQQRGEVLEGKGAGAGQRTGGAPRHADQPRHCCTTEPCLPSVRVSPPIPQVLCWDSAAGARSSSPLVSVPSGGAGSPETLSLFSLQPGQR